MSLDHFAVLPDRRFQPSERQYDPLLPPPSWYAKDPFSQHTPSWSPGLYTTQWSSNAVPASPYPPSNPPYRHSHTTYDSPRSVSSSAHPSLAGSISPPPSYARTHHPHPPSFAAPLTTWADPMYALDSSHSDPPPTSSNAASPSARASSISSSVSVPPVKLEHDEAPSTDCFVIEFSPNTPAAQASSSLAPPTEVPLRATQASKSMRKMMGVFRLNPFTMHETSGHTTTTWSGEDPGPLDEEPQMFEFQLDIPGSEPPSPPIQPAPIRSHSPDELHPRDLNGPASWADAHQSQSHYSNLSHPAWLGSDAPASYSLPGLRPYSPHAPQSPSLSASPRRAPLDTATCDYSTGYTLPPPNTCSQPMDNIPSISSMARRWSNPTNIQAPFMI